MIHSRHWIGDNEAMDYCALLEFVSSHELLDHIIKGKKLREIVTEVEVFERTV
jgi:hypothetical protein